MAVPIQNLRSGTATKRPVASGLAFGQVAVNYNEADPAVYLRGDANALIKVSPVFVGTIAPNATPASGGSSGNSKGEQWLDTTSSPPSPKIFDGSAFIGSYTFASGTALIQPVLTGGTVSGSTIISPTFSGTTFQGNAGASFFTSEWILGAVGSNDYTFTGPGFIGAESDPSLYLVRGQRYKFTNTMGMHPFRIQSTPNGSTGTAYSDGVTNNDVINGSLTWDVQFDAPDVLYYQCTAHGTMGGKIYIVDAANLAKLNATQSFTAAQRGAVVTLAGTGTVTPDFAIANNFQMTLSGATTLAFPSGVASGQSGAIRIAQNNNFVISYSGAWRFPEGEVPSNTTVSGASDLLVYYAHSATAITAQLLPNIS